MSEEPEVSPLRLKRPGAGGHPSPATPPAAGPASPAPVGAPPPATEPPLAPLPGLPPPAVGAASEAHAAERTRRRPSLSADNLVPSTPAAPVSSHPAPPPAAPDHPPVAPASPDETAPAPAVHATFKLKVGAKPPPPPLPASSTPAPGADPIGALESAPVLGEAPLLPLPGFGPGSTSVGAHHAPPPVPPAPVSGHPPSLGGEHSSPVSGADGGLAPRAPIHLRAEGPAEALDPSNLPPPLPARAAKAAVSRQNARRDALFFGLLFLLVLAGGAGAYFYFTRPEAAQETTAGVKTKLTEAGKVPAKVVDEAKKGLAGERGKEQMRVDALADGREAPPDRAVGNVTATELEAKLREKNGALPSAATQQADPVASAPVSPTETVSAYAGQRTPFDQTPAPPPQAPLPGPRFVRYAEGIRVSGVFQGSPARALIDGRLVRQGDIIEGTLGIKFADIDVEAKQIILEDATGARVKVKYL